MKRVIFLVALSGILLSRVWAERFENDHRGDEARVILYQHANFQGDSLVIYPGEVLENFSGRTFAQGNALNDSVSSIRVEGGAEVFVYSDSRFRGAVMRLTEDVRDLSRRRLSDDTLENWNDRISSLRVEERHRRRERDDDRETDYDGVIKRAYLDLLGHSPDERGLRNYRGLMIDQGWTERMVRDHIQQGDEFRHEGIDRIIHRVYREVLGRDVDSSGLNHYRREMRERNWSEGDLRDDLRRSEEFRKKSGGR